jgi:hypothetical protein
MPNLFNGYMDQRSHSQPSAWENIRLPDLEENKEAPRVAPEDRWSDLPCWARNYIRSFKNPVR